MKNLVYSSLFLLLLGMLPLTGFALDLADSPKDTITIQIGNKKKIIIWVEDKKDLAELQEYDLNKMISQLSKTIDSLEHANQIIIITDDKGEQLKISIESGKKVATADKSDSEVINEEEENEEESADADKWWYKHDSDTTYRDTTRHENNNQNNINLGIHFNRKDKDHSYHFGTRHHLEFDLGMNNYLNSNGEIPGTNNEQYVVRPWGSWFVGINSNFRTHVAGPLAFQWGGGISWYNFKFEDDRTRLEKTPEELLFVNESRMDINPDKAKLTASYLNLNLVPMLDFRYKTRTITTEDGKRKRVKHYEDGAFRIGLGGYAGYRIGSHTKYKYNDGNTQREKERDNFYLNNFRYGARLQLGFKGVDLFANYDMNDLFSVRKAPELHAVSFGIVL